MESLSDVTPYEYEPLVEDKAIRLMTLFPGKFHDDIIIDISTPNFERKIISPYMTLYRTPAAILKRNPPSSSKYSIGRRSHVSHNLKKGLQYYLRNGDQEASATGSKPLDQKIMSEIANRQEPRRSIALFTP